MAQWQIVKEQANIPLMSQTLNISEELAQLMVNRGIRTKNTAIKYLNPDIRYMNDGSQMKDMVKAVDLIAERVSLGEKLVIYGDYDVDGVTSTAILYKTLKNYGADVSFYIPHREEEGYGLNINAVRDLRESEFDVIIACDNGISALMEVLEAKKLGMSVIIIDHHEPGFMEDADGNKLDIIPKADAVVDPKQQDCPYPFGHLCAAGLCFKFAEVFHSRLNLPFNNRDELMVLAMLATFCDIVDLLDENRVIAKNGLEILNANKKINKGLWALLSEKGYAEKEITEFVIGFIVGPCINATGRLETAAAAVELLITEDRDEALAHAQKLSELNDERKQMTAEAVESAMSVLESQEPDRVVVLYDEKVHESIAGIVAGRIKERIYRPVIMLTPGSEFVKGSARSIEGYDIFAELYKCKDLFERFGGHKMAAGLSLREENIPELKRRLNENCTLSDGDFDEKIKIDDQLDLDKITYELAREISIMAPFGKENRTPLFLTAAAEPERLRIIEEKNTMIFTFCLPDSYRRIKGLCFGKIDEFREQLLELFDDYDTDKIMNGILRGAELLLDMIYSVEINEYNNDVSVQIKIKYFRLRRRSE